MLLKYQGKFCKSYRIKNYTEIKKFNRNFRDIRTNYVKIF